MRALLYLVQFSDQWGFVRLSWRPLPKGMDELEGGFQDGGYFSRSFFTILKNSMLAFEQVHLS
jgi:hypothetical protein